MPRQLIGVSATVESRCEVPGRVCRAQSRVGRALVDAVTTPTRSLRTAQQMWTTDLCPRHLHHLRLTPHVQHRFSTKAFLDQEFILRWVEGSPMRSSGAF